jgi:cytochrome c-type biogenesis protein
MTAELLAALAAALWTGVITSVSPCPLATNLTALAWLSRHSGAHRLAVLGHGLLYAAGRALAYLVIGFLLVQSLLSAPALSFFMQKYGNQALSPLLVLAGMYLLGMFGAGFEGFNFFDLSKFKAKASALSSLLMGALFALAFCPISAALYFGVIIPLAAGNSSPVTIPLLYGLGTALPVIGSALALDLGLKKMSAVTGLAGRFEHWAKPFTAWVFIAAGVYLGLKYTFVVI